MCDTKKRESRAWVEYEEQLLIDNYPTGALSAKELGELLGRSQGSIKRKLTHLGLTLIQEEIPEGYHKCCRCRTIQPRENFASSVNRHRGLDTYCSTCVAIKVQERIARYKERGYNTPEFITCTKCGETKHNTEYYNMKASSTGKYRQCKACSAASAARARKLKKAAKEALKKESL